MFLLRQPSPHRMVMQYHPLIGHTFVPNLKARIPHESGGYMLKTNSLGFRSDFEFSDKRGDRPRILFFGDSMTAGDGVRNDQRFSDLVGQDLDAEVFNFGLSGTGTDQQLLILENFANTVEADLIVFCVFVRNIERNLKSHRESIDRTTGKRLLVPKPYFTLENGNLDLHHVPVPKIRPEAHESKTRKSGIPKSSISRKLVHRFHHLFNNSEMKRFKNAFYTSQFRSKYLKWAQLQPFADYLSADSPGWQLMEAILQRFVTKASPVPVLIIPIPTNYFYRYEIEPIYKERFESLRNQSSGVYVSDITLPLQKSSQADLARMTFKVDQHFSAFGNRRIADLISNEILSNRSSSAAAIMPPS